MKEPNVGILNAKITIPIASADVTWNPECASDESEFGGAREACENRPSVTMVAAMLPLTLALLPGPFSAPGVLRTATAPGVLRAAPAPALMSLRGASAAKAAKASSGAKVKQVLSTKRWWRPSQACCPRS